PAPPRQTHKLAIGVVQSVGDDMKRHPRDVDAQIAIIIKVASDHSDNAAQKSHGSRRYVQFGKKLGEPKANRPVEMKIEIALGLARLVCRLDGRTCLRDWPRH